VLDNAGIIGSAADARLSVATLDNRNRLEAGGTLTLQGGVLRQQAAATALARVAGRGRRRSSTTVACMASRQWTCAPLS
jgi:hypothetical protein